MTQDISNRRLLTGIAVSLFLAATLSAASQLWHQPWTRPGSAVGQSLAIIGACLLTLSAWSAMRKRNGEPARRNFGVHIWLACSGFVLVGVHSGGNLAAPPALLLLALLALMALGAWARTIGARQMAATFGTKTGALSAYDVPLRKRLRSILEDKQSILAHIDPSAEEATFSLAPGHWLGSPAAAARYQRLVREERALLGTDRSVGRAQAYWRRLHRLIAVLFLVGLLAHVTLVTFFAGYVAEGGDIYWWHLAAWDF